jgi:hypothetical protein
MTGPVPAPSLTGDAATDAVLPAAVNLVWAVRQDSQDEVAGALLDAADALSGRVERPDVVSLSALVVVLAAMVPDDQSPAELLAWRRNRDGYLRLREAGFDSRTAAQFAAEGDRKGHVA